MCTKDLRTSLAETMGAAATAEDVPGIAHRRKGAVWAWCTMYGKLRDRSPEKAASGEKGASRKARLGRVGVAVRHAISVASGPEGSCA